MAKHFLALFHIVQASVEDIVRTELEKALCTILRRIENEKSYVVLGLNNIPTLQYKLKQFFILGALKREHFDMHCLRVLRIALF